MDVINSVFINLFLVVSLPLAVFFILLFLFVFRRRIRLSKSPSQIQPQTIQAQVPSQPKVDVDLSKVTSRIDKMQSDITKAITDSNTELKDTIEGLGKNLEDLALAIKSTKSDSESPFNSVIEDTKKMASDIISVSSKKEYSVDLKKLVQLSTLLAIMDYDKEKIMALFKLDLLSPDDIAMLAKIEDVLSKNKGKISASDLAIIAYDIARTYESADADTVKYVSLVLGDRNGGRSDK
jgi:hypothetical protein